VTGRPDLVLGEALLEALRPIVADLVDQELERRFAERDDRSDETIYFTTAEYAERFKTTPGAVLARVRRGTLRAIRPPGSREWLIPVNDREYDAE
jgi:hypothetical protein